MEGTIKPHPLNSKPHKTCYWRWLRQLETIQATILVVPEWEVGRCTGGYIFKRGLTQWILVIKKNNNNNNEEVMRAFEEYQGTMKSVFFKFLTRVQSSGESFGHFYTDLKLKAKRCNYDNLEDRTVRDRIVIGKTDKTLQETSYIKSYIRWGCKENQRGGKW